MSSENPTILDYLRHGKPAGGKRFRGSGIDDPLSRKGWRQMRKTTEATGGWERVASSPMRRCAEFAKWFADEHGLPLEIHQDLREVGFGNWEGMLRAEVKARRSAEYEAFYRDPVNNRPAGAEPLDAFGTRVGAVFDRLLSEHHGRRVLVVAHAGVIRATLGHVTRAAPVHWYRTSVDHAGLSRFSQDRRGLHLEAHNWRPSL